MRVLQWLLVFLAYLPAMLWSAGFPAAPGDIYRLDSNRSQVLIRVYRSGWAAALGHNHLLAVQGLSGQIRGNADTGATAELEFSVADMLLDDPQLRAAAGEDFSSVPSSEDISGTRANMLGSNVLDARRYPIVKISLQSAQCANQQCMAEVDIHVRGAENRYSVPLEIEQMDGTFRINGRLELYQSSFNIQPFGVFGGALRVVDRLEVDFKLFALHILQKDIYE